MKISVTFITEVEKSTLKFIWKHKKMNSQGNTEPIPNFKLYYRAIPIKNSMELAQKQL
jgi:uncharacterized FlgJ-related protein